MKFISLLRPRYMLATQAKCIYNKNGVFRVTALDKINSFLHQIQHTHIGQITLYYPYSCRYFDLGTSYFANEIKPVNNDT